jgi:hypothetical protein
MQARNNNTVDILGSQAKEAYLIVQLLLRALKKDQKSKCHMHKQYMRLFFICVSLLSAGRAGFSSSIPPPPPSV